MLKFLPTTPLPGFRVGQPKGQQGFAGLDTPELRQKFHRVITGQGITSYPELLNIARQIKAGTY